jgi:uncharacterized protein
MPPLQKTADGIELQVWVAPRCSREGLGPLHGDRLRAAVSAPPVDGEANEAVRTLVARTLQVSRGQVQITRGATGRNKTVRISGEVEVLWQRAAALLHSSAAATAETESKSVLQSDASQAAGPKPAVVVQARTLIGRKGSKR